MCMLGAYFFFITECSQSYEDDHDGNGSGGDGGDDHDLIVGYNIGDDDHDGLVGVLVNPVICKRVILYS